MDRDSLDFKREQLEKAIAAQEQLRGALDDEIIDTAIAALQNQLSQLAPDPVLEQQRKQVTILFMDVVSSTQMVRELDPEENLAIMDTALQQLAEPVKTFGGRVTRFMGDGFLAVFGLPRARENDPERAVRAGLGILQECSVIASNLKANFNIEGFEVRVGVNTGLVVAGGVTEAEGTIMGSAVNLAARLESAAPPGSVLISQYTHEQVGGVFDFEQGEPVPMKGFPEPIRVYLVKSAKPLKFHFKTRGIEGVETPMVGREAEMSVLQETTEVVVQNTTGQFVTIVGETGIGKSRLLDEFETWLVQHPENFKILKARAGLDSASIPYSLLRNLFNTQLDIMDDDTAPTVRQKIANRFGEVLGAEKESQMYAHFVGQLLGYDFTGSPHLQGVLDAPQQIRDRALIYLVDYLRTLTASQPLAIFLDDIHRADDSSLDMLAGIFDALSDQSVLFIALSRPALYSRRPSWGELDIHHRLDLDLLTTEESDHLLEIVLQKLDDIPARLRNLITTNAAGNPYYLEELVKMLLEEGVIIAGEISWQVLPDRLLSLKVPATLTGVIQARLDRLSDVQRRVLQQASVVGKVFWDAALVHIDQHETDDHHQPVNQGAMSKILSELEQRDLLTRGEGSAFSGAEEFVFKHAILQEVTYESVLKRTRRSYHGLAADWLISYSGDRVREVTGLIARHLERAEKTSEAFDYFCLAAEQAESNYAIEEAVDFIDSALALSAEEDIERQFALYMSLSDILRMQGDLDRQKNVLDQLSLLSDQFGDEIKTIEVLIQKAWFGFWTSDFPAGLEFADQAVLLAEKCGENSLSVQAYYVSGWLKSLTGDNDQALDQAKTALSLVSEIGDPRLTGNINNLLGIINNSIGNFYHAMGFFEAFLEISKQIRDQEREITALNNMGISLTRLGDYQGAREKVKRMRDIVQETGDHSALGTSYINLAWIEVSDGNYEKALQYAELGTQSKRKQGQLEPLAEGLLWMGHAYQGLDQMEKAVLVYQESMEYRERLNQQPLIMGIHAALARVAISQADPEKALEHANQILTFLDSGGDLSSVWEPVRIYLSCYQALKANNISRAREVLEVAHIFLQEQAEWISNSAYRSMFLENISWHKETVEAWQERLA